MRFFQLSTAPTEKVASPVLDRIFLSDYFYIYGKQNLVNLWSEFKNIAKNTVYTKGEKSRRVLNKMAPSHLRLIREHLG